MMSDSSATERHVKIVSRKTVVGVFLLREDGAALLQLRDNKPDLPRAGMWSLPGGHCEPGESIEMSARRELQEETGYACRELYPIADVADFEDRDDKMSGPHHLVVYWAPYDGKQPVECREGQTIRFVERGEASHYPIPAHLLPVWDRSLAALQATKGMRTTMTPRPWAVPYVALGQQANEIKGELMTAFEAALDRGHYVLGPDVAVFEQAFANYCQSAFAVGVGSGTSALSLVLRWLGIGPGDEVITVPNSFVASASSIAMMGARPVFVDVGPDLNVDPDQMASAITPRTKAIMPVHLTGRPVRMPAVLEIAKRHELFVLEDAAQSIGAALHGRRVGGWGDAACFSLHPLKNLHAMGDGGMVTTSNPSLREWLLQARNHGLRTRDECEFWSVNSRLDEVQAALLRVQLRHLDQWTDERRRLAFRYNELLRPYVEVPEEGPGEYCVYQTYMVQADHRDVLVPWLREQGVEAVVHYPTPLHLQPAARALGYSAKDFPMTMRAAGRVMSLPLYPGLTTAQQDRVVELIETFYRQRPRG